jgi:hypothetical protein
LSGPLVLPSFVILRGEGQDKTVLAFTRPLGDSIGPRENGGSSEWSWSGGLIWAGPADTFEASGAVANVGAERAQGWEYWRPGAKLAAVKGVAARGDTQVAVDNPTAFKPGQLVLMAWENPGDSSLLKHIAGHPAMEAYNWSSASFIRPPQTPQFLWPVMVRDVRGNQVVLAQPLRLDIRPEWKVGFSEIGPHVEFVGIEKLTLKLKAPLDHKHLRNVGWNGIYFNRAYNAWAREVTITDAENPIIFASSKNCTADQILVNGPAQNHHSIAIRVMSHDCLVQHFTVKGPVRVKHGINIEWLSSGNVYSKGKMDKGTFDSHRGLSFDLIRTEISLRNDADGPGGHGSAGPFLGARVAHWNIDARESVRPDKGEFVFMPLSFPMGAFVGIQGTPISRGLRDTAPGEKGALVADEGKVPDPPNLYEAQVRLRLGR